MICRECKTRQAYHRGLCRTCAAAARAAVRHDCETDWLYARLAQQAICGSWSRRERAERLVVPKQAYEIPRRQVVRD